MHNTLKIKSLLFLSAIMWITLVNSQAFAAPEIVTYCGPADCGLSQWIEKQIEPSCRALSPAWNYYKNWEEINGATIWCMDFYVDDVNKIPEQCGWPYNHNELVDWSYMRCADQWIEGVSAWTPQVNNTPVNGSCGSAANGQYFTSAPTTNLCEFGSNTPVQLNGWWWWWSCNWLNGGTNIACKAIGAVSNTPVNGSCGTANGQYLTSTPTTNLCALGSNTVVEWSGPWSWSCNWLNGGTNQSCQANKSVVIWNNAQCGPIHGTEIESTPLQNELCSAGTASVLSGSGPWSWSCSSTQSGGWLTSSETANCWADKVCSDIIKETPIMCNTNDPSLAWVCYTPTISAATFIVTNNKVGINTMDPEYNLDVNGTMRAAQVLVLSDERAKEHIEKIENALEKIRAINGYEFTWKNNWNPDMWVLAQEIEKVFAEAVRTDKNGIKTVQYNSLIAPIIQAINELNSMIDTQLEKANKQADHITTLEQKVK